MIGKPVRSNTRMYSWHLVQWVTNSDPGEAALGFGGGGHHRENTSEESVMLFQVSHRFWCERTGICPCITEKQPVGGSVFTDRAEAGIQAL